ncbi:MAG: DEAD/DEAH box helicase, partial [Bacteroidota bacterium]
FLLPILNKIIDEGYPENDISVLIIVPTRELALQIDQQIEGFSYYLGVSSLPIYGGGDGQSWEQQRTALTKGVDIVVATPGRLIQHLNMSYSNFSNVKHLILDEADRMLDMGFHDDIVTIIEALGETRQNLLFSATFPDGIRSLAKNILTDPEEISLALSKPAEGVLQAAYNVYDDNKIPLINHLLEGKEKYPSIIIFSSTKKNVMTIVRALRKANFPAEGISSDLDQKEREKVLREFKSRKTQILVATDILARGIDIKEISLVINYDVPMDAEDYVHRVGRTARASSTGVALTLINPKDQKRFSRIEKLIEAEIMKVDTPSHIGDSPKYQPKKHSGKSYHKGKGKKNKGKFRKSKK